MDEKYVIVSVGGSLIVPDEIDTSFLDKLRVTIGAIQKDGYRFILMTGGGKTSRKYGAAASEFEGVDQTDIDALGITACQLNAHLLRLVFKGTEVKINPDLDLYVPGASSDRAAVRTAIKYGAKKIVNLSNISHVYTADPKKDPNAQKIEEITWSEFRNIIPKEFSPNLSSPFDPAAAKEADEAGIEVATMSGENLDELKKYLHGEPFTGSVIR
jgi:uridylate kinase